MKRKWFGSLVLCSVLLLAVLSGGCRTTGNAGVEKVAYLPGGVQPVPLGAQAVNEKVEVRDLVGLSNPANWTWEECEVSASDKGGESLPAVRMHIPVDYYAGEKAYPIGWPRMYYLLKAEDFGWQNYDFFEFQIYTEMSCEKIPKAALTMTLYTHSKAKNYISFGENLNMKKGEWVKVVLPISKVQEIEDFHRIGINISESNYKHGDVLDFHLGGFRLLRSTSCKVASLQAGPVCLYEDAGVLTVDIEITGPESDVTRGVPFELSKAGKGIRRETLPVRRGRQTLKMDVSELQLEPGDYMLTAFPENPEKGCAVPVKIVESPWRSGK